VLRSASCRTTREFADCGGWHFWPAAGSVTLNSDGSFAYTPATAAVGSDTFVYGASDGTNASQATVTVQVTNQAPVAVDHAYTMLHGQTLTVRAAAGVLQGASDADADSLTAGGGGYGPLLGMPPSTATVRHVHRGSGYTNGQLLYAVTDGVVTTSATVSSSA